MTSHLPRRRFILAGATALGGASIVPLLAGRSFAEEQSATSQPTPLPEGFPSQDAESVRETVGAAHSNFDRVKELVTARPALAKSAWDWGFGDWETPLGAACHVGQRRIAEFLIEHGARPDLFTFASFGNLAALKAAAEGIPGVQRVRGPHGITLLQHAKNRMGADDVTAAETANLKQVVEFLTSLGGADETEADREIAVDEKRALIGSYALGSPTASDTLEVALNKRDILTIARGKQSPRNLRCVEPNTFAPVGAPAVRIRFELTDGKAASLTIHDPIPIVKALRR